MVVVAPAATRVEQEYPAQQILEEAAAVLVGLIAHLALAVGAVLV
jgi:hypothetical protein